MFGEMQPWPVILSLVAFVVGFVISSAFLWWANMDTVKKVALATLKEHPADARKVMAMVIVRHGFSPSIRMVYTVMEHLERRGKIKTVGAHEDGRRIYTITGSR